MNLERFRHFFPTIKNINWYPGHMANATKTIMNQMSEVDLIIEVRDFRLPFSSSNPVLDALGAKKRRLVVMNKTDLGNMNMKHRIEQVFQEQNQPLIFTTANRGGSKIKQVIEWCQDNSASQFKLTGGTIILIVGLPNVGKSSLINAFRKHSTSDKLAQSRRMAIVGDKPGVTRRVDMIKINHRPSIFVLDTPGVMMPKITNPELGMRLALIGAIKDEIVGVELLAEYMLRILNQQSTTKPYQTYLQLENQVEDIFELFRIVERRSGAIGKSEEDRQILAAKYLLAAFRKGDLGKFTLDQLQ